MRHVDVEGIGQTVPVQGVMSYLADQASFLKILDSQSDAFPHRLIFKDGVRSGDADREQTEKALAGCFRHETKETVRLVFDKLGQLFPL